MKIRATFTDREGNSYVTEMEGPTLPVLIDQLIAVLEAPVMLHDQKVPADEYWADVWVEMM
jgi:hypothetical protein